ncbi:branched-chain amino acid ABC transporter permease [Thermodesulfobacteriota bacterium]
MKDRTYIGKGIFILAVALVPLVTESQYYLTVGNFIGLYAIIAIGLALLLGYAGQVSMAQAAFFGIGAYTSSVLTTAYAVNPWLALVAGMILAAVIAGVIGIPLLKLEGHVLAVATLALSIVIYTIFVEWEGITGGYDGIGGISGLSLFGMELNSDIQYYYLIWLTVLLIFILSANLVNSRVGRALRSIHRFSGGSETAAQSLGVSPTKYKVQVFMLSASYASLAGSLYAHWIAFINPEPFGIFISILMLIMVTIGGMGSLWGAIIGSTVIVLSGELFREIVPKLIPRAAGEMEHIAYGAILVLMLLFMPRGLVSAPLLIKELKLRVKGKSSGKKRAF